MTQNTGTFTDSDAAVSGVISATDAVLGVHGGAGVMLSGTPTASSYLALALSGGDSGFIIQLSGTFGAGTVWFECSASSTNGVDGLWTTLSMRVLGTTGSTINDSATIAGLYRGDTAGMTYIRARVTGATAPSIVVVIRASSGVGPLALNAPIPAGTQVMGTVNVQGAAVAIQTLSVVAATPVNGAGLDVSKAANVTWIVKNTIAGTVWTGAPVLVFEQSDDNVSWGPMGVVRCDTGLYAATFTLAPLTASAELMFDAAAEGINWVRVRVTTAQGTAGMTIVTQPGGMPFSPAVALVGPATKAASTAAVVGDQSLTVALSPNSPVPAPTLTKGTQGAAGFTTQDLKDAGRLSVMLTASVPSTAAAETLITLTKSAGLAAVTTGTSLAITSGKKFRIQAMVISARNSAGTVTSNVTVRLRAAVAGATTAASPLQFSTTVNIPASTVSVVFPTVLIPDGFEIDSNAGTNTYGVTITHPQWVTVSTIATFDISIIGYEY
jgi:hypothetical protein